MGEGQVEEGGDVDTAENVKVGEVALGNTDDADKRALNWSIEGFAIVEEFQHYSWKMILQKRDDTAVEDHEDGEEYEDTPHKVEIIAKHPHFRFHRFSPPASCLPVLSAVVQSTVVQCQLVLLLTGMRLLKTGFVLV